MSLAVTCPLHLLSILTDWMHYKFVLMVQQCLENEVPWQLLHSSGHRHHQLTALHSIDIMLLYNEWVSEQSLTSRSTHNRSFRGRVFPGNHLHWYWQLKTNQRKYTKNTKSNPIYNIYLQQTDTRKHNTKKSLVPKSISEKGCAYGFSSRRCRG